MIIHSLCFIVLLVLSLAKRVVSRKQWLSNIKNLPTDPIPSPLSQALSDMLGTAGGIYLALLMLVSFLKIEVPSMVDIFGMEIEPLAFISIVFTLVQPYVVEIKQYWGG
ncbi:hypothetical protein [Candidatus Contubernalis alkaliaceticus]|uniref:hypothetical protein n=1 Tax=Candidatus Contubernalis alkaliaceticus TaxID=338645 RepID=UPI001F4C2BC3|nr:hypothetical protein [Candidatus Contubernalis alkalaceticus]UNC91848.1 hypothetical protein HUE98_06900 [Candidatus Contubernalis alkalaceticus]